MYLIVASLIVLIAPIGYVNGQFGEIASLVSGVLSPALVGSAASGAAGAVGGAAGAATNLLNSIGTLYQIAQGALQLTGTGVGILNQASEGKWFSNVVEGAMNNNREIQERILAGRGVAPDYAQLGTNFPAPAPEDYDHEDFHTPDGLISISSSSTITDKSTTTETPAVTLFPEEKETTDPDAKQNRKSQTKNLVIDWTENGNGVEDRSGEQVKQELGGSPIFSNYDDEEELQNKESKEMEEKMTKLAQLITLLRESNLTESDLREMTRLLEKVQGIVKSKATSTTIPTTEKPPLSTAEVSRESPTVNFRHVKFDETTDNEDSDLLPIVTTTPRPRAKAARIKWRSKDRLENDLITAPPRRQFPRRTAYAAPLPFITRTIFSTPSTTVLPKFDISGRAEKTAEAETKSIYSGGANNLHSEDRHSKTIIYGIRVLQRKPDAPREQISNSVVPNSIPQRYLPLPPPTPVPEVIRPPPPLIVPQPLAPNVFQPQPSYVPIYGNSNINVQWPYQNPSYIPSQTYLPVQRQYGSINPYSAWNQRLSFQNVNSAQATYAPFRWSG